MRILLAALAIAVLAGTSGAQEMGGGRKGRGASQSGQQQQADQQRKQKAIDDAYKSAISRIPDSKTKYDPWKSVR